MEVYAVICDHYTEEDVPCTSLLGIFSTRPKAVFALESNGFVPNEILQGCWERGTTEYAYVVPKTMNQLTEEI